MKIRFFALAAIAGLLLNIAGFAVASPLQASSGKHRASRIVSLLPASDGVLVFDSKRFLEEALPKLLAANQPILNEITSKLSEMEAQTGIEIRKFDQVAVGFTMKQTAGKKEPDVEPVVIAGGEINASSLIALAKVASKGKFREEKVGETPVYVFTIPNKPKAAPKTTSSSSAKARTSKIKGMIDQGVKRLDTEVAAATLDENTLVIGSLARVRETIEAGSTVSADINALLFAKETALASFAFKTPAGMARSFGLDADELGANIDGIQYLSGSLDVAAAGTSLQLMARTTKPEQAEALKDLLEVLRSLGGHALATSKKPDQKMLGRIVKSAKLDARGNDVSLDLLVPQADIDILVAKIK